jgi:integrase/recombinase XerC
MTNEIVHVPHQHAGPHLPAARTTDVLESWLSGRNPRTLEGYRRDLALFADWLGAGSPDAAVELFLSSGPAHANRLALTWRSSMTEGGLASATIARRLAALRSMVKVARLIGRVNWSLEVEGPRAEPRRDMRGPDLTDVRLLWRAASIGDGPRERRDRAVLALLFDLGLRRAELCGIDRADVEAGPAGPAAVWIRGEGRAEKGRLTLPGPTARALAAWLEVRGARPVGASARWGRWRARPTQRRERPADRAAAGGGRRAIETDPTARTETFGGDRGPGCREGHP